MENTHYSINIKYISIKFNDDEAIFYLRIQNEFADFMGANISNSDNRLDRTNIVFIAPVLHSSDGEVRTFGFIEEFLLNNEVLFEYSIRKSTIATNAFNKFRDYAWNMFEYIEVTNNYNINIKTSDQAIKHYNKINLSDQEYDIKTKNNLVIKLMIYYLYIKLVYGNDLSNIESRDVNLVKFIEEKTNLNAEEYKEIMKIFEDRFWLPYTLIYNTHKLVIKITPIRHDSEWIFNKFLYYINNYEANNNIFITIPTYQYFRYAFDIGTFLVNDKLLIKLKFSNTKVVKTNVYIGVNVGKPVYQNLLDIKNNIEERIIKFKPIDYHNLIVMNFLNLRAVHLSGLSHNDLHLNNILFKEEPEFISYQQEMINVHNLRYMYKFFLHIGSIDFTIIDFGRATFINERDAIMKRIKKLNKEFYIQYFHALNEKFDKDLKMTGYVMTMFDYIEYIQSIKIGFKWIGDDNLDYNKLQQIIEYCYEIIETYLTGKNKKLVSNIADILSVGHYEYMPEYMFEFIKENTSLTIGMLCEKFLPRDNRHPIDLVISKFFPENIMSDDKKIDAGGYLFELGNQLDSV